MDTVYELIENVHLTDTDLCIETGDSVKESIRFSDVIGVEKFSVEANDVVVVYVIEKHKTKKWTKKPLKLSGHKDDCEKLVYDLESKLEKLPTRPRRLLVMISPIAGSQNSEKIFSEMVAPLFKLARIETKVIVSESENHMLEYVSTCEIEKFDGIAVCGGDGSFNQCMNAVFERTQKVAQIDYNNPATKLKATEVPIGHIPTGSHNMLANYCNGCFDVQTATLSIIQGSTGKLNMINLYSNNKWKRGCCLGIIHGNVCEFACYVNNYRWLKTARYALMLPYYTLFHKMPCFDVAFTLLSSFILENPERTKMVQAIKVGMNSEAPEEESSSLVSETVEETCVDVLISCQETYHPGCYIGSSRWLSDHALLNIYTQCSRLQLLKNYFNRLLWSENYVHPEFVKEKKIIGYKMKIKSSNIAQNRIINGTENKIYQLAVDGEIIELDSPEWETRHHQNIITVFTSLT